MGHAVHFRDVTGEVQLEDLTSLEAALERVEHLRNDDGVTEVRVFREIPIEVRTYYRVTAVAEPVVGEVGSEHPDGAHDAPSDDASPDEVTSPAVVEPPSGAMVMSPPPVAPVAEVAVPDGVEGPADAHVTEGRRPLFSRS
jgi:hypothetical protein